MESEFLIQANQIPKSFYYFLRARLSLNCNNLTLRSPRAPVILSGRPLRFPDEIRFFQRANAQRYAKSRAPVLIEINSAARH